MLEPLQLNLLDSTLYLMIYKGKSEQTYDEVLLGSDLFSPWNLLVPNLPEAPVLLVSNFDGQGNEPHLRHFRAL